MSARRSSIALLLTALGGFFAASCGDERAIPVDRSRIHIVADSIALRTGPVGEGKWRSTATYVLVETRNRTETDVMVTLAGELEDASGRAIGRLRRESLRIPAGGARLFALVDGEQAERPTAARAEIELVGAVAATYRPPFVVREGNVFLDQDRAVAAGYLVNTAERDGSAVVIGAFFDQAGAPLSRTSTLFALSGGGRRGVRLVGPPGSRSAYLFVGEVSY